MRQYFTVNALDIEARDAIEGGSVQEDIDPQSFQLDEGEERSMIDRKSREATDVKELERVCDIIIFFFDCLKIDCVSYPFSCNVRVW